MASTRMSGRPKSLKAKAIKADAAAKVRGGGVVALKKLPGKRTPPTLTLK